MARRRLNRDGTVAEAAWQTQVEQLARFYGWRVYHTHDSRRSAPGFPDLVLVRPPELVFAELKTDRGRTTPEQREWLDDLREVADAVAAVGAAARDYAPGFMDEPVAVDVYLWRPADFDDVHARLARGRVRHEPIGAV